MIQSGRNNFHNGNVVAPLKFISAIISSVRWQYFHNGNVVAPLKYSNPANNLDTDIPEFPQRKRCGPIEASLAKWTRAKLNAFPQRKRCGPIEALQTKQH